MCVCVCVCVWGGGGGGGGVNHNSQVFHDTGISLQISTFVNKSLRVIVSFFPAVCPYVCVCLSVTG